MSRLVFILLALILAACQPAPVAQVAPQAPVKVALSPSLTWLENDLAACAEAVGTAVQRVDGEPEGADVITLQLGAPDSNTYAALLGQDELVLIVHPDNPLSELSFEDTLAIFSGQQKAWPDDLEILAWSLPATSDAQTAMLAAGFTFAGTGQAASPQAMLSAVASNPAAIGYLPARWVDASVRAVDVSGIQVDLPILAISAQEPQGSAHALLVCLQEKIGQ